MIEKLLTVLGLMKKMDYTTCVAKTMTLLLFHNYAKIRFSHDAAFMSWCIKVFVLLAPYVCFHIFS